jgi:CheY-like chemotaxis protein
LRFYEVAAPLVGGSNDHALKGAFHNELGAVLNDIGLAEQREDYIDRALVEFAAASFHFEQAENYRYLARVDNNLGFLFFTIGRHGEAHKHLDRARLLFLELDDVGTVAQIDDTRARTLLAEGRLVEAERFARSAVKTLEKGGEQSLLAEALNTQAIVLARKGAFTSAKGLLERAIEVANTAGDLEGAGRASLSIIEELNEQTPPKELISAYRSAVDLLRGSQDPVVSKRLFACAGTLIDALATSIEDDDEAKDHSWEGFSFKQQVLNYEKRLIERALKDAGTSVTAAARLLGFKHHQNLIAVINSRHKDLLKTRSAVRKRRRHLFSEPRKTRSKLTGIVRPEQTTAQISVLHVEDNKQIGRLIQDTLAAEAIHVDSCVSGTVAMEILKSDARYDAIIVDNDLPGLSGLELILRVRSMANRRDTPIIMLSGDDCEKEAWRAGAKAFLKKPEQISELSGTVARLLRSRTSRKPKLEMT